MPYVYYDAATITALTTPPLTSSWWLDGTTVTGLSTAGVCTPYWLDAGGGLANPDSFQIICAGGDDIYGIVPTTAYTPMSPPQKRLYPSGTNYDSSARRADDDNVTNFCSKVRLIDAKP